MRNSRLFMLLIAGLMLVFALPVTVSGQENTLTNDEALTIAHEALNLLQTGDAETLYAQFSPEVQAAITADQVATIWSQLESQMGAYVGEIAAVVNDVESLKQVILTLEFESTAAAGVAIDAIIAVNPNRQISGLFFRPNYDLPAADATAEATPDYIVADNFTETDVIVGENGAYPLPGTLAMPVVGDGELVPAVVLVHGSGPNDRDSTIGPNKPLRDVAWGLASSGIAVLRYDKRTLMYGAEMAQMTDLTVYDETIEDALLAVELLRNTPGIDPDRIYVFGHSLGGVVMPRTAAAALAADVRIAGIIVAAGSMNETLELESLRQIRYLAELDGSVSEDEQAAIDSAEMVAAAIAALDENSDLNALLFTPEEAEQLAPSMRAFNSPAGYWYDLRQYDPVATALELDVPMLVLAGERDYQVTMDGFNRWQTALADRPNTTFISYPALNHLLMAGEGTPNPSEYGVRGHVSAELIADVLNWIRGE